MMGDYWSIAVCHLLCIGSFTFERSIACLKECIIQAVPSVGHDV